MKKIIALVLSLILVCCCSVTAFAAESPVADEKVTVVVRKADYVDFDGKSDVKYTVEKDKLITVQDDSEYGKFNSWTVYKADGSAEAVEGVDFEVVSGSFTEQKMTVKAKASIIVCANYNGVKTNPVVESNADNSASAPQTGDMATAYIAVIMLAAVVFGFGVKKAYSK